jgi:hypothetical protein
VGKFTQIHGAGHAGITLEGVQQARNGVRGGGLRRIFAPGGEVTVQVTQLILRFFEEERQQLLIQIVVEQR